MQGGLGEQKRDILKLREEVRLGFVRWLRWGFGEDGVESHGFLFLEGIKNVSFLGWCLGCLCFVLCVSKLLKGECHLGYFDEE